MRKVFNLLGMTGRIYVIKSTDWQGACRRERAPLATFTPVEKSLITGYKYWQMLFDKLLRVFAASAMIRSCSSQGQLLIRV